MPMRFLIRDTGKTSRVLTESWARNRSFLTNTVEAGTERGSRKQPNLNGYEDLCLPHGVIGENQSHRLWRRRIGRRIRGMFNVNLTAPNRNQARLLHLRAVFPGDGLRRSTRARAS